MGRLIPTDKTCGRSTEPLVQIKYDAAKKVANASGVPTANPAMRRLPLPLDAIALASLAPKKITQSMPTEPPRIAPSATRALHGRSRGRDIPGRPRAHAFAAHPRRNTNHKNKEQNKLFPLPGAAAPPEHPPPAKKTQYTLRKTQ